MAFTAWQEEFSLICLSKIASGLAFVILITGCYQNDLVRKRHKPENEAYREIVGAMILRSMQCTGSIDDAIISTAVLEIDCGADKLCDGRTVQNCINQVALTPCKPSPLVFLSADCIFGLNSEGSNLFDERNLSRDLGVE